MDIFVYTAIGVIIFWITVLYKLKQKKKYLDLSTIGIGFFAGILWPITLFLILGGIIWETWLEEKKK